MIRALHVFLKRFVITVAFLAGFCAPMASWASSVETYIDDALPPDSGIASGQPLSPGQLTMQDILRSVTVKKKIAPPPNPIAAHAAVYAPPSANQTKDVLTVPASVLAPAPAVVTPAASSQPAAEDVQIGPMLQQGLQNLFGASPPPQPVMQVPAAATSAPIPLTPAEPPSQPQNIARDISAAPLPDVAPARPAASKAESLNPAVASAPGCTPTSNSWTKGCAEAGYPSNYVGLIRGETRSTCPSGNLEDVWIANSCVPPDDSAAASSPTALTSPSPTPPPSAASTGPIDASCGSANGLAAKTRPAYELCMSGTTSPVTGNGPWHWNCEGTNGGMNVSCAAPVAATAEAAHSQPVMREANAPMPEDAQCGAAHGTVAAAPPETDLCAKGTPSHVNGSGPWTWACSGSNGGRAAACSAPKRVEGLCGAANASATEQMPTSDLCKAGLASAVTGDGPWNWTCSGLNGGRAATCSASSRLNAVCGPASMNGRSDVPKDGLCNVGKASAVSGSGPWSWVCAGLNGGASVSCEAKLSLGGACGTAHGAVLASAPIEHLCASGKASRVVGNGPWSWTCSGTDGGDTATCMAALGAEPAEPTPPSAPQAAGVSAADLCGEASEFVAIEAPTKNLCKSGTASAISGHGPWNWTCSDHGQKSSCSTLSLSSGEEAPAPSPAAPLASAGAAASALQPPACGNAAGQGLTSAPVRDLCAAGKASAVSGNGPWSWSCSKGKARTSCIADKIANGQCGPANGSLQKTPPTAGLCSSGKATAVQGSGPWAWSCVGTGGGTSISCSAASLSQARVDGNCGAVANKSLSAPPKTNLCDSGVSSVVYGDGPWTWTCSGLNGGVAASCTSQKNTPPAPLPPGPAVNGLCGPANGVAMAVQPAENLCTTGTASAVSGNGPWNWNCIGENSGMTVSCTAPLQPPDPISGLCGAANGIPSLTTPRSGLCSSGISSAVSGRGPWTWSCSGVNGGSAVGCVAPLAGADIGSLPSITTPAEAPAPKPAPMPGVVKKGLVTPRLPAPALPPVEEKPSLGQSDMSPPAEAPQLPEDIQGVTPPPLRDFIQPASALKADTEGNVLPGNHFALNEGLSTIPFVRGSDNFDSSVAETLRRLADVLQQNGGVRITLTAYADNTGTTPREARRLSLSRALAIRDYLTSRGISSSRIDVRALGANVPSGDPDRVDVKAN